MRQPWGYPNRQRLQGFIQFLEGKINWLDRQIKRRVKEREKLKGRLARARQRLTRT